MHKILFYLVLIPPSLAFLQWIYNFYHIEVEKEVIKPLENSDAVGDVRKNEADKNLNVEELKNFYKHEPLCKQNIIKYDNLVKSIDNYVQRYVNLFLITSNLRDHDVQDLNKIITIDLEISLTGEDLIYLQGYSKSSPVYPKNFSKLDAIFYKIAKQKEKTFMERAMRQSHSFFESFNVFNAFNNPSFSHFFPLLGALLVTVLIHVFSTNKTFYVFVGMLLNSFLLWESLNFYWKKLKEVEVEIYVKKLELKNAPEKCNPANAGWYDTLLNLPSLFKSESECLQYYKNINKNAVEEVSILKCIIDTYSYYLIQTPFRIFGACIRDLTEEITSIWPWTVKYFISVPYAVFFFVAILSFIFLLYAKQIKLSTFGLAIEIGRRQSVAGQTIAVLEKKAVIDTETSRTNRIVRKLRPWTKSRFPKRLEMDLGKRRKLLKSSRSLSEIPIESQPDINVSTEDLDNYEDD